MIWLLSSIITIVGLIVLTLRQKVNAILRTLLKVSKTSDDNDRTLDQRLKAVQDVLHAASRRNDELEEKLEELTRRMQQVESKFRK